jgi:hypothetical protein
MRRYLRQSVPEDFLSSLNVPGGRPNLDSRAYLVQMELEGAGMRTLYRYERGFQTLDFSNAQSKLPSETSFNVKTYTAAADRLFELGLATIAGSFPLRTLTSRQVNG